MQADFMLGLYRGLVMSIYLYLYKNNSLQTNFTVRGEYMESVIQTIRQARGNNMKQGNEVKNSNAPFLTETVIEGCQVKMRFDAVGDSKIMANIQSMLMAAHIDSSLATPPQGGESA